MRRQSFRCVMRRTTVVATATLVALFVSSLLPAQQGRRGAGRAPQFGGQNITVQGVYIDAKGVLRYRKPTHGLAARFRKHRKLDPSLVAVSLPRLFAEARQLLAAGKPLPSRMRYLDGLVKVKYIVIDRERKDLLIAGPAEPIDDTNPLRPQGKRTGRPVLQLDDLVVALRSVGPGRKTKAFGCTLLQDPQAAARVKALQQKVRTVRAGNQRRLQQALKKAIGPLQAKFFGVPADTRFAFVCIESDYRMKRISLGREQPPVNGLRSYLSMSNGGSLLNWFWFVADYPPLPVSEDGSIYEIPAHGLALKANNIAGKGANPAAEKFAALFTQKLPEMEQAVPAFADLQNLADLALLAALIDADRLHERVGWDLGWLLNPARRERNEPGARATGTAYRVAKVPTPRQAETLVNFKTRGRRTVTVAGGVRLSVRRAVTRRKTTGMITGRQTIPKGLEDLRVWSKRIPPPR